MNGASEWCDCKEELKFCRRARCVETKAFHRQSNDDGKNTPSPDRVGADESGESQQESDDCTRLAFDRVISEEFPVNDKPVTEQKKKKQRFYRCGQGARKSCL